MQVGFGLYPVIVKLFAADQKANPVIFSFYRQVLIHTQSSAHDPGLTSQPPFTSQSEASKHTGVLRSRHLFSRFIQRCLLFPGTVSLCLCCRAQDPYTQPKNAYCKSSLVPLALLRKFKKSKCRWGQGMSINPPIVIIYSFKFCVYLAAILVVPPLCYM